MARRAKKGNKKENWAASPIIRVRTAGTVYTLLTIVLGVVAVNSGNNLLYLVTALLLGYMLASGVAGRRNLTGAQASLVLPDEIYAGRPFQAAVKLENNRRSSLHLIEVALRVEGGEGEPPRAFFGLVPAKCALSRDVVLTLPRRGEARVALEVASSFPFDFFTRFAWKTAQAEALAFPAPVLDDAALAAGGEDKNEEKEKEIQEALAGRQPDNDASNVAGIRPYQTGDPMNRVHWKISARTGKLSTRLFDGASTRAIMIDLDALVSRGLEHGLSLAAGRILQAGRENLPVGMVDRGTVLPPATTRTERLALLAHLALYESRGAAMNAMKARSAMNLNRNPNVNSKEAMAG